MGNQIIATLKPGKEQSVFRRHPWIFSGAIKHIKGNASEGDLVIVVDSKGEFLAIGHYQIGSIAIRIITFDNVEIDDRFWLQKLESAFKLRQELGLIDNETTNVFRLVNAEGDEMPGLVIDFYNGTAVTQFHSIGIFLQKDKIINALRQVLGQKLNAIFDKSESTMPFKSAIRPVNGYLWNTSTNFEVQENSNRFKIDWVLGQKTGFFIDQRENRKLVMTYSKGKNVLNMFCYTGGFSVYALRGGANIVHSVDSSKKAIELTNENVELNFPNCSNHEAIAFDAFDYLNSTDHIYDLIILDPPAFAKHNEAVHNALQGYKRLSQRAIEIIKPGGLIFTFSCSQVVSREEFRKSVFAAAANAKRKVSILHQLSQPADHAVSIYHPEGEYLKGLVLYVE
jgi:23S rRNA (cytosine1962-C5)-methyltransferase